MASDMQQMACCKAGHDHCPMEGNDPSDCCRISGPTFHSQPTTLIEPFSAVRPLIVSYAWVGASVLSLVPSPRSRTVFESSPPGAALRPPAYIAHAALLI